MIAGFRLKPMATPLTFRVMILAAIHVSTQMSWTRAALYFVPLPIAILLFRLFVTEALPALLAPWLKGLQIKAFYLGIVLATCILGVGVVSSGYALIGLLNYTAIDAEGINQYRFRQPTKHQVWNELFLVEPMTKQLTEKKWGAPVRVVDQTDGMNLYFKEGGRWTVKMTVWENEFLPADYRVFTDWLHERIQKTTK